jgi:alpha-1,2-mannosyltransferase
VNTDASAQATADAPGSDSRPGLSPGRVMAGATIPALAIRLFTLTRPGFLTQSTNYDDGACPGAAIRLTQGVLPYKDFALVQPPGIVLLMAPVPNEAGVSGGAG